MIEKYQKKRKICGKTDNQIEYLKKIYSNDLIIVNGPAGTGKSYCAIGNAVISLQRKKYEKIIVAKPMRGADVNLGALPGNIHQKIQFTFQPFIDIFLDFITENGFKELCQNKIIDMLPITYWRGLTFNDCYIIIDELQNCTVQQLKLIISRMGQNSKMLLLGDVEQSDITSKNAMQLCLEKKEKLEGIEGIAFQEMTDEDLMRNKLINHINKALFSV